MWATSCVSVCLCVCVCVHASKPTGIEHLQSWQCIIFINLWNLPCTYLLLCWYTCWLVCCGPVSQYITLLVSTELAEDFLNDYTHVTIGSTNLVANHDITQIIEMCSQDEKPTMWVTCRVKLYNYKVLVLLSLVRTVHF